MLHAPHESVDETLKLSLIKAPVEHLAFNVSVQKMKSLSLTKWKLLSSIFGVSGNYFLQADSVVLVIKSGHSNELMSSVFVIIFVCHSPECVTDFAWRFGCEEYRWHWAFPEDITQINPCSIGATPAQTTSNRTILQINVTNRQDFLKVKNHIIFFRCK